MPKAQLNNDNKVGCHLHSITSDPVVSAVATGANAVPIRRKVLGLVARVRLKTANKLVVLVDDDCMTDVHADLHSLEQPSVNALE